MVARFTKIVSSKSFGTMVTTFEELAQAVSTYTTRAAEKLRAQDSVCSGIHVFVQTNPFRQQDRQYSNGVTITLEQASGDTRQLVAAALKSLGTLYRPGYAYKKAGVRLMDISSQHSKQPSLFVSQEAESRADKLMVLLDQLNESLGRDTVSLASSGLQQPWAARFESRTPRYTTRWDELPVAK